ncbi:hypothetical protein SAMN05660691_03960 [Rheinheimera pacifica]|uniref:Uncharacterized protein n=1 Tax=Rheinheimera pacifica TaxID=173990 RepID=A0A1H6NNR7_9GAMM|nr:hypothetical protein [Rheinheimera pacifica]SEI12458.1 hypothetical protein SAMN05660691_03960 [Rheinheimera pacifica]
MRVYNADRKESKFNSKIFRHLGTSPVAAAERVEGMFSHQQHCAINLDYSVSIFDILGRVILEKSLEQHLVDFCNYAKTFHISEYCIIANNPLRLIDLWEDDPIGSAGPMVIDKSQISLSEQREIQAIFHPFYSVIHPPHIFNSMSFKDIKAIKRNYLSNILFKEELKKRKDRSHAIGEDFNIAQYQEIVWLDLTFKLKKWALGKGYDSFVYSNKKEGNGEDAYITLLPGQLKSTGIALEFLEDKYLSEMPKVIKEMVDRYRGRSLEKVYHALWGQNDPMRYWK